ncbi:MAG: hypothetical protein KDA72_20495 [Planctomycetales bacterium]|nr:hypothetical protein [Planctomycetales bacterium]
MFFRSLRKNNSFARKAVSLLVLCGVLLATAPIPIGWKPKSTTASSEPFPCQDCHCGCLTPEQCWTSCCCYTPEERLAWAIENGVEPPSYAVLVNKAEKLVSNPKFIGNKTACQNGTCEHGVGLCAAVVNTNSDGCCAPKRLACTTCQKAKQALASVADVTLEQEPSELVAVLSLSAMKCQGFSSEFNLLPWATLQRHSISCSFPEPIVTPFEVRDEWLPSSSSQPAAPPPRFSADV